MNRIDTGQCGALVYPREGFRAPPRPCTRAAVKDGYCRIHQPGYQTASARAAEERRKNSPMAVKEREVAELRTQLDAWQSVFGTSQLSHAQARLTAAEETLARLRVLLSEVFAPVNAVVEPGGWAYIMLRCDMLERVQRELPPQ